jgi:hypothetical protein
MQTYDELVTEVLTEFPEFTIQPKAGSRFMRIIGAIFSVVTGPAFMREYTTTIGYAVLTPEGWDGRSEYYRLAILRHERIHMRQARRYGRFWFSLAYLLLPLPFGLAYARARFEWEAYLETLRARVEFYGLGSLTAEFREQILRQFTGPAYLWMWPFRATVERWYDDEIRRLRSAGPPHQA